ncbi:MAG: tRNA pseudouridine synthase A [Bacteroidales bacterium]|nr:tRNA pseudouridine synthase A [Bacteroidales bacterium]
MRYKILLSYDGSAFCGWQVQPGVPSVQECLQNALSTLLGEEIAVTGAGRTDAGVHAVRYAAHFDALSDRLDAGILGYKLNAILPSSVVVHEVTPVSPSFHARFDAVSRTYMYFINSLKDPFTEHYSWRCSWPLDVEAMNRAASLLLGTHDFSCFEKTGGANKTSICTVTEAFWAPCSPTALSLLGLPPAALAPGADSRTAGGLSCAGGDLPSGPCPSLPEASTGSFQGAASADGIPRQASPSGAFAVTTQAPTPAPTSLSAAAGSQAPENYLAFRVTADRFLRNMVRAMVGTLIDVGRGKRSPESMTALLESRDRCSAGESVPARALFLVDVRY